MNMALMTVFGCALGIRMDQHEAFKHEDSEKAREQRPSQPIAQHWRAFRDHVEKGRAEQHPAREAHRQEQAAP
jgi:hypothetical protein